MITQKCVKMTHQRRKIVDKRPNLKKAMLDMDKKDSTSLRSQESARAAALEALNEASDFVLVYLNEEGGGTVGAVSGKRRKPMMELLVETLKSMAKSALETMLELEEEDEH
jgi:hypothetical protein